MEAPVVTNFIRNKCHINDATLPYLQGWSPAETDNVPIVLIDVQVGADSKRSKNVFYLNSLESPRLVLKRNTKYKLIVNTPGHPFYFYDGKRQLTSPTERSSQFLDTSKFPATFQYGCSNHSGMNGIGKFM
jgi:hypothetical protein